MYGHNNPTIRTTDEGEQVGPRMHAAVGVLARYDALPSMKQLAEKVGPNGSLKYGYRVVKRCQRKGLISRPDPDHPESNPHGTGAISVTEKGQQYLEQHD